MSGHRIYRKVSVSMWGDEKFRKLSRLEPTGQALWVFLMTGPHTTALPGLFRAGEPALADELGWPIREFRRLFEEVARLGMAKADWDAKLVWLPHAMAHNEPDNPNTLKHWSGAWDVLPECPLKREAFAALQAYCRGRGEQFLDVLETHFRQASGNVPPKVPANVAENVDRTSSADFAKPVAVTEAGTGTESAARNVFEHWVARMQKRGTVKFAGKRRALVLARLRDGYSEDELKRAIDGCAATDWNMGRDPKTSGRVYNDLTLICRDAERVERFRDAAPTAPTAPPSQTVDEFGHPIQSARGAA